MAPKAVVKAVTALRQAGERASSKQSTSSSSTAKAKGKARAAAKKKGKAEDSRNASKETVDPSSSDLCRSSSKDSIAEERVGSLTSLESTAAGSDAPIVTDGAAKDSDATGWDDAPCNDVIAAKEGGAGIKDASSEPDQLEEKAEAVDAEVASAKLPAGAGMKAVAYCRQRQSKESGAQASQEVGAEAKKDVEEPSADRPIVSRQVPLASVDTQSETSVEAAHVPVVSKCRIVYGHYRKEFEVIDGCLQWNDIDKEYRISMVFKGDYKKSLVDVEGEVKKPLRGVFSCLTPGLTYKLVLDADKTVSDPDGGNVRRKVAVPRSTIPEGMRG